MRRHLAGVRRDGSEFPIEMVLTPFRAQPGMVMMVVIDDTERRKAEERQNLLIGELHHRTQNIFAVIQSVAMRTLSGERTLSDARNVFLARLHAMSRTYTMLTEGAWEGALLERIVSDELAAISSQATVSGPAVMIQASAAQTFAMIVHELATNALKFGALSVPAGHVTVGWEVLPAPGGAELSFLWQERGGPPVIGPLHKGFGRSVLEDAARRLGRAEITYAPAGLRYTFATPLASVGWSLAPVKAP